MADARPRSVDGDAAEGRVWIVFCGEYEQRGPIGPAFTHLEDAKVFAADFGDDIEEFELHSGTPVPMTNYEYKGWLPDVTNTVNPPNDHEDDLRLYRQSWASWDVLVPDLEVRTDCWSLRDGKENFAVAQGRNEIQVRAACVAALRGLTDA